MKVKRKLQICIIKDDKKVKDDEDCSAQIENVFKVKRKFKIIIFTHAKYISSQIEDNPVAENKIAESRADKNFESRHIQHGSEQLLCSLD